ncbi:deoxycytidine triphosphate deaminase [Mycobacteroides abscessus subsp. abscessus]|jgi:deoxycytidine triphosphate deaminase|nr:deoxycytidine triphosphate deaminase [Mycobacteroides abscessus subsp. abscessus]
MLVVGDNLKELIKQHNIVNQEDSFDNTSISLRLGRKVIHMEPDTVGEVINYGDEIPQCFFKEEQLTNAGLILPPKSCILACSYEKVDIPNGYFGLLQTKGSLARLFVSLTCTDGQIEPGYKGNITFEICNHSNFSIRIRPKQYVGQLFLFKTSTKQVVLYEGKYQNAEGPTIHRAES